MKGFYYIENTTDEWHSSPSAYFETLDEAKRAIKDCEDWWRPSGTGKIYFQPFGFSKNQRPKFVCRGCGIDKETGEVIFKNSQFR